MVRLGVFAVSLTGLAIGTVAAAPPPSVAAPPAAWGRCAICHSNAKGAPARIGPNLYGVVGARAGARPGFGYSAALKGSKLVWDRATLARYIANPAAVAPGTTMPAPNVSPAERDALVAYLAMLK